MVLNSTFSALVLRLELQSPFLEVVFLRIGKGNLVLPKLNASGLKQLAIAGGGQYQRLGVDDSDLHSLLAGLDDHHLDQSGETTAAVGERWREEGVWLLWPLLALAALAFRRGWLLVLPLLLLLPPPAEALSWQELWQTPDQQAAQAFTEKDYTGAAQQFQNPRWKASAFYRSGDFTAAAKLLDAPQSVDDWYNQGNALAKSGDFSAALKAYQHALELKPGDADTEFNKNLVEKALQQQQKQQNQKKGDSQQNQQDNNDQSNKPGDKKNQKGDEHSKSTESKSSADEGDHSSDQQLKRKKIVIKMGKDQPDKQKNRKRVILLHRMRQKNKKKQLNNQLKRLKIKRVNLLMNNLTSHLLRRVLWIKLLKRLNNASQGSCCNKFQMTPVDCYGVNFSISTVNAVNNLKRIDHGK